MRTPAGDSYVGLVPHKGVHLPGWYHAKLFRFTTLGEGPATCRSGYLLYQPATSSGGGGGTAGDLVPELAVVGGRMEGWYAVVYHIADHMLGRWAVGYYRPSIQRSFIMRISEIYNPQNMKILIFD